MNTKETTGVDQIRAICDAYYAKTISARKAIHQVAAIVSPPPPFLEILKQFMLGHNKADTRQGLTHFQPWIDGDENSDPLKARCYFKLQWLMIEAKQMGLRVTKRQLIKQIRELGGGSHVFNIKFNNVQRGQWVQEMIYVWWIPTKKLPNVVGW